MDRDGDLDVVVGNDAPDPKRVYANDGKGNFSLLSTFGHAEWPTRLATVADVNGDGLPDILVANRPEDVKVPNYVCINRGGGRFDADCDAFSQEPATTITPADMNRDGIVDLIVPNRAGGQSYVYINDGKGAFRDRIPFGPNDPQIRMRASQVADLNRDGLMDIVVIDERRGALIFFQVKQSVPRAVAGGYGVFSPPVRFSSKGATPYALTTGDLNRDGAIDIVVGNVEAPSVVYFNDGTGRHFTPVKFGDGKGTVYGLAIGDLDGDGVKDIAAARSEAPNVVYFGGF